MSLTKFESIIIFLLLISSLFIANLHVAFGNNQENIDLSSIKIGQTINNSYPITSNYATAKVEEHQITAVELEDLKNKVGVYEEGQNYNQLINGHGTGLRPPTEDEWTIIGASAYFVENVDYLSSPSSVDQSAKAWFPPIGHQDGEGSCVAWAVGYYTKTFQEAKEHGWDLSGASWEGGYYGYPTLSYQNRIISPDFIYHLINDGVDNGAYYSSGINLVCSIGASSWEKMPYDPLISTTWPSEEAWTEAPLYRGDSGGIQYMNVDSDAGLVNLKNWIASENLAVISIDANKYSVLTSEDLWTTDNYVSPSTNHANTIVGYDDTMAFVEDGELHYGAFKVANSWGVGSWENVNDGFLWISYETMKQRIGYCMFYYDIIDYAPDLLASFNIDHEKRSECEITVGLGNPSAPTASKSFTQYIRGGNLPFCENDIVFDITELKDYVPSVYNQEFFLEVFDEGTSTTGTIYKFAVEYAESEDVPLNTIQSGNVYADVVLLRDAPELFNPYAPTVPLTSGIVGQKVLVVGSFGHGEAVPFSTVTAYWDSVSGNVFGTTYADVNGEYSMNVTIPAAVAGMHHIVIDDGGIEIENAEFTVTPRLVINDAIPIGDPRALPGDSLTASGTGFAGSDTITLFFNSTILDPPVEFTIVTPTITTDTTGSFTATIEVPETLVPEDFDTYTANATDAESNTAIDTVIIDYYITCSPAYAPVDVTTIIAGRIAPSVDYTLRFNSANILTGTTTADGTFSEYYTIPGILSTGPYIVDVVWETVNTRSTSFTVVPSPEIVLGATIGVAGDTISISGTLFSQLASVTLYFDTIVVNNTAMGMGTTSMMGALAPGLTFVVPSLTPGVYAVTVGDQYGATSTAVFFTIFPTPLTVHNLDTSLDYETIQSAINAPETLNGHTIFVDSGTHNENVVVNKSLSIIGENPNNTIVDGGEAGDVIKISTDNVQITNFTIQNSGEMGSGLNLMICNNSIITNNNITQNFRGLNVAFSAFGFFRNNTLVENSQNLGVMGLDMDYFIQDMDTSNVVNGKPVYYWINKENVQVPSDAGFVTLVNCTNVSVKNLNLSNNINGLTVAFSNSSIIENNNATNNHMGIGLFGGSFFNQIIRNNIQNNLQCGIVGFGSDYRMPNNTISQNQISENAYGIYLAMSSNTTISSNNITINNIGIYFTETNNSTVYQNIIQDNDLGIEFNMNVENNKFYHNSIINNTVEASSLTNYWDDGYPSGGNYWTDYSGVDANDDGIGDIPYIIDEYNQDNYPLMNPITTGSSQNNFLVVRGLNNQIYCKLHNSTTESWSSWSGLPGFTFDSPAVAVVEDVMHLVVRGIHDNQIWYSYLNLTDSVFSGWTKVDGATPSAPTLAANSSHLCLVVRGNNNKIYYKFYDLESGVWGGWLGVPTGFTFTTPAASLVGGDLEIVVQGTTNNYIWHGTIDGTDDTWSGWTKVDGATPSAPTLSN